MNQPFLYLLLDAFPTFVQKVCRAASLNILQGVGGRSSVCPSFSLAAINKEKPTAGSIGSGACLLMCKVIIYMARVCSSKGRGKSPGSCAALQEPWCCAGQCSRPAPPLLPPLFALNVLWLNRDASLRSEHNCNLFVQQTGGVFFSSCMVPHGLIARGAPGFGFAAPHLLRVLFCVCRQPGVVSALGFLQISHS